MRPSFHTETQLSQWLSRAKCFSFYCRIEAWNQRGIPDTYVILDRHAIWIELKIVEKNGQRFVEPLKPQQCSWHIRHWKAGGVSWILAASIDTDLCFLWPGRFAIELVEFGPHQPSFADRITERWLTECLLTNSR